MARPRADVGGPLGIELALSSGPASDSTRAWLSWLEAKCDGQKSDDNHKTTCERRSCGMPAEWADDGTRLSCTSCPDRKHRPTLLRQAAD